MYHVHPVNPLYYFELCLRYDYYEGIDILDKIKDVFQKHRLHIINFFYDPDGVKSNLRITVFPDAVKPSTAVEIFQELIQILPAEIIDPSCLFQIPQ